MNSITKRKSKEVTIAGSKYSVTEWTVDRFPDILEDLIYLFGKFPVGADTKITKAELAKKLPGMFFEFIRDRELYPTMRRVLVNICGLPEEIETPTVTEFLALADAVLEVNDIQEVKNRFFLLREHMSRAGILDLTGENPKE